MLKKKKSQKLEKKKKKKKPSVKHIRKQNSGQMSRRSKTCFLTRYSQFINYSSNEKQDKKNAKYVSGSKITLSSEKVWLIKTHSFFFHP